MSIVLSSKRLRRSGLLAVLGSILWTATWILVPFTAGGTQDVLGLSERGWRTLLLNPAMLCFMAGLAAFHAKQAERSGGVGKIGFVICLLGLGGMLLGNIVEFWVSDPLYGTQEPGWNMMGVGLLFMASGLLVFGVGTLRVDIFSGWRRAVPFVFGMLLTLLIIGGVAWIVFSGSALQLGLFRAVIFSIAAGWGALGLALAAPYRSSTGHGEASAV